MAAYIKQFRRQPMFSFEGMGVNNIDGPQVQLPGLHSGVTPSED